MILSKYGYVRAAAAVPRVTVGDPAVNGREIARLINAAAREDAVTVMAFPELSVTGFTCADLFYQRALIDGAEAALAAILDETRDSGVLAAVGMPVKSGGRLYNCAVVLFAGAVVGVVPGGARAFGDAFSQSRWFTPAAPGAGGTVRLCGADVPFGGDIVFKARGGPLAVGVEAGGDIRNPAPGGANLILALSAAGESAGGAEYRRAHIGQKSLESCAGYVFSSAGQGESTADAVFSGHALLAAGGRVLGESLYTDKSSYIFADIDIEKLCFDRKRRMGPAEDAAPESSRSVLLDMGAGRETGAAFKVEPRPFVPRDTAARDGRCREIFRMQTVGLSERLRKTGIKKAVIGLSGGLDSTLALLVTVEAFRALGRPETDIIGVTMPGPGTTRRTHTNARALMAGFGVTTREIPIDEACLLHLRDIGHSPQALDVTYENVQARERTQILMDLANKEGGLVVGTGGLSELALGWCTYNGDHMSHYGVNSGVPKTLIAHLTAWYARTSADAAVAPALEDILDTPISPELLPADGDGDIAQKTEDVLGPYELHDFFLYHMLRNGFSPRKILKLATMAFHGKYEGGQIVSCLETFYRRFFSQQFKRACQPDGVRVGSVHLSPRGHWQMPSDACGALWLRELADAAAELAEGTL